MVDETRVIEAARRELILRLALKALIIDAETYMDYHDEKFYADRQVKPSGLRPSIAKAKHVLESVKAS